MNTNNKNKQKSFFIYILIGLFITVCFTQNVVGQKNIKEEGYNKLYHDNGKLASEGFSKNGQPEGYWKTYYSNGKIKTEGNREGFLLSGIWKFYDENGRLKNEITYSKNLKNGFSRSYDELGNLLKQTPFTNDTIEGILEEYFPDGKTKRKTPYKAGLKNGEQRIYAPEDGRVIWLVQYEKNAVVNREAINRFNDAEQKTGLWIEFHPNEVKKLVGSYVNNQKDGIFKEYDENGKLLNIYEYNNGQLVDNETALNVIEQDKYYYPSGQVKRIETKQGKRKQGFTKTFNEDGTLQLSQIFRNDTLVAEGNQNELGQNVGLWKYYWPNGKIESTGNFDAGKKNGLWKYYFRTGELEQEGNWKNDVLDKEWKWYFKDGKNRCIMHFENGKEDGDYIEFDQYNYTVAEGKYSEGYKVGKWYYSGGDQVAVGKYRDGLKDGDWKYYFYEEEPESLLFTGSFRDGEPDGIQRYYYEKGKIWFSKEYKAGLKNGVFVYNFKDGVERYRLEYALDELVSVNGIPFKDIESYFE